MSGSVRTAPAAAPARGRLPAAERRSQLLRVAGRCFAEYGYHGLSMEQLADAAGVSKPVLYQHFPSKRALYLAVIHDALDEMEARLRTALEGTTDNRARVEQAIGAYFDFIDDSRFALITTAELSDETVAAAVDEARRRVASMVGALIASDAGLSPASAQFLANGVRGLATEGARWWIEHAEISKDEAVRLLARLAWRGLGSFGPDAPSLPKVLPSP